MRESGQHVEVADDGEWPWTWWKFLAIMAGLGGAWKKNVEEGSKEDEENC